LSQEGLDKIFSDWKFDNEIFKAYKNNNLQKLNYFSIVNYIKFYSAQPSPNPILNLLGYFIYKNILYSYINTFRVIIHHILTIEYCYYY